MTKRSLSFALLVFMASTLLAAAASPKRVLILNPYSREVEPFRGTVSGFRSTLAHEYGQPLDLQEIPLDLARTGGSAEEEPLVAFIEDRVRRGPVDLVVPIGTAGVQFVERHGERLFAATPILAVGVEPRALSGDLAKRNATLVTQRADLPGFVEDILQLKPDTDHIAVVLGSSPLEKFWVAECRLEFKALEGRVKFTWLDGLPFDAAIERCSQLPPRSFILHVLFLTDAAGISLEASEALKQLHRSANAPVFACFESDLGMGAVGGRLMQNTSMGVRGAKIAIEILGGRRAGEIPPMRLETATPTYDWRELRRWNIPESRLPTGSVVLFREPSFWDRYRWPLIGVVCFGLIESALIVGLLVNRRRRIRGEQEASLVAEISSKFINLPAVDVDPEIIAALRRICEFLDLDLAVLWQVPDGAEGDFIATHAYQLQGGPMPSLPFRQEDFPWVRSEMAAGRMVVLATLDDLPAEAAKDKESVRRFGVRSNLTIPLSVGGRQAIGVLGFNAIRKERAWPESLVKRLQLLAQIFANALARKRADLALRESELRLNMATESAGAGLWVLEWSSGKFWANGNARALFGYTADEPIDMARFEASVFPEDWPRVKDSLENSVKTGAPVDVEYSIKLADRTDKWIVSRGRPFFRSDGAPERLVGLSMDITERKRSAEAFLAAEEEAEELRRNLTHLSRVNTLGALSGSLAHELNQPLGIILSNAEAAQELLLQDPPDVAEVQAILTDIIAADRRAGEVIERLRALLKRGQATLTPLPLNQVIEEVLHLIRGDLIARGVTVVCELAAGLPPVAGDRVQLQQLVLNLILNAADAMESNPPEARRVHLHTLLRDGRIRASVRDEGSGLTTDLERLFQPFYTTKSKGLGLGLSICWSIVAAHHGQLWAEPHPKRGAIFLFELPVDETLEKA